MTEQELALKVDDLTRKVDAIYESTEKTRKYFLWTMIISIVLFVLPLFVLLFAVPSFLSSYTNTLTDAGVSGTPSLQQQIDELTR